MAWSRHTYDRPQGDTLKLIGSVKRGMQVGALAITEEGQYVQLVGDHITPLNNKVIAKAVAHAAKDCAALITAFAEESLTRIAGQHTAAPVVTVKKRRVAVMP